MTADSYELCTAVALKLLAAVDFQVDDEERAAFVRKAVEQAATTESAVQHTVFTQMKVIATKFPDEISRVLEALSAECARRTAASSLAEITSRTPVYALLSAISAVVPHVQFEEGEKGEQFAAFLRTNVVEECFRAAKLVEPVLHSLSPEGIVITEDGTIVCDDDLDVQKDDVLGQLMAQKLESQTLLVGCWRTLKAVSTIFSDLLVQAPDWLLEGGWSGLLPRFFDYFWTQLTTCRHRGAFEIASVGFQAVCDRFAKLFTADHPLNPAVWLQQALSAATGGVDVHRLCSTRRSAGLPHLIVSILRSYQPPFNRRYDGNLHLDATIARLSDCRRLEVTFEVHSVNILRVLLQSTVFRNQIPKHLEPVLLLAFEGLRADNWAVRNAHAQLFSSIVHRIFGTENFNRVGRGCSLSEFMSNFPNAYLLMVRILKTADVLHGGGEFEVHPVLVLLFHLRPTPLDEHSLELLEHVHRIALTSSRHLVRQAAVQAISALTDVDSLLAVFEAKYVDLLQMSIRLPFNALSALFQVLGLVLQKANGEQAAGLLTAFERTFLADDFDLLQLPDFVLVVVFKEVVSVALDRQLPLDFARLAAKLDGRLEGDDRRASRVLFLELCGRQAVENARMDVGMCAKIIEQGGVVEAGALKNALKEAVDRRDVLRAQKLIALLAAQGDVPLASLLDSDCSWLKDSSFAVYLLESQVKCSSEYRLTEDEWRVLNECEESLHALRILSLLLDGRADQREEVELRIAVFLQSESDDEREEAARLLSARLLPVQLPLHWGVCWPLAVERWSGLLERVEEVNGRELVESSSPDCGPGSVSSACPKKAAVHFLVQRLEDTTAAE
ncbi:DUF2428 domain-containing protein [Aphelenchoides fujianensis]|nr:DUF2428 domain-containing protein [Aphelenchoides fujianensis]